VRRLSPAGSNRLNDTAFTCTAVFHPLASVGSKHNPLQVFPLFESFGHCQEHCIKQALFLAAGWAESQAVPTVIVIIPPADFSNLMPNDGAEFLILSSG